jgi:hypothetical protein
MILVIIRPFELALRILKKLLMLLPSLPNITSASDHTERELKLCDGDSRNYSKGLMLTYACLLFLNILNLGILWLLVSLSNFKLGQL